VKHVVTFLAAYAQVPEHKRDRQLPSGVSIHQEAPSISYVSSALDKWSHKKNKTS